MNEEYLQYVHDKMIRQRVAALKKSEPKAAPVVKLDPIERMFRDARGKAEPAVTVDPATVKDPISKMFAEARKG